MVDVPPYHAATLIFTHETLVANGPEKARLLILHGKPISEPVVQYGLFVMNNEAEIRQAGEAGLGVNRQVTHVLSSVGPE